mmetsp:Transcript_119918/g.208220  ORF Transcript_119918/g.208220 Transcript_119918/m.208220 type:complete len:379 (+) Transcript_119918:62-1198(+)
MAVPRWLLLWTIRVHHAATAVHWDQAEIVNLDPAEAVNFLRPKGYIPPTLPTTTAAPIEIGSGPGLGVLPAQFPAWLLISFMMCTSVLMAVLHWRMSYEQDTLPTKGKSILGGFFSSESTSSLPDTEDTFPGQSPVSRTASPYDRNQHKVAWFQYFAISYWCLLLSTQAAFTRLWCQYGIPRDCQAHTTTVEFVKANHMLMIYGFMLAVLTGLNLPSRFHYIFCFTLPKPRGFLFLAIFFLASPGWGSLDLVPALSSFSLTEDSTRGNLNRLLVLILLAGSLGASLWHFHHAWVHDIAEGFVAYVVIRLVMFLLLVGYFLGSHDLSTVSFHLHHWIVGFYFAVLAEFNHPVSLVLLAAGSGVFAQGIAAYGADSVTEH